MNKTKKKIYSDLEMLKDKTVQCEAMLRVFTSVHKMSRKQVKEYAKKSAKGSARTPRRKRFKYLGKMLKDFDRCYIAYINKNGLTVDEVRNQLVEHLDNNKLLVEFITVEFNDMLPTIKFHPINTFEYKILIK